MKDELKKLARELREASKALNAASHQAGQAAATLDDKRAELAAVKESNQELQDQHIQETQVRMWPHLLMPNQEPGVLRHGCAVTHDLQRSERSCLCYEFPEPSG